MSPFNLFFFLFLCCYTIVKIVSLLLILQNPFGITDQSDLSDNSEDYVDIDGLEDSLNEVKRAWNNLKSTWGKRDSSDWASMKGIACL